MAPAAVRALHDAFRAALFDPASLAALARFDRPLLYLGAEEYDAFARRLFEEEGAAVRRLGLRMD